VAPIEGASNFCPAMAVPMTVKIPEPITAPMPSAVSDHGPRLFFSERPGSSDSRMSLSIDLRASSWLGSSVLLTSQGKSFARGILSQNTSPSGRGRSSG
jgi:hypothetical protein